MKDMTLTQSYFVCAVGRRGQLSGLSVERQVCLLGAGLLELALAGCITLGKNTAAVCAPLPAGCACLQEYFSKFEQRQLRGRLRTLSQTEAGRRVQQMMDYVYNMIAVSTALIAVYH